MRFIVNNKVSQAYSYENVMKYEDVLEELRKFLLMKSVSEAYSYENVIKYENVLNELLAVHRRKDIEYINKWTDEHLNTHTKTTDITDEDRYD